MDNRTSKKEKKNFIWNMLGSTTFGFTSLIFMIIVTRINGVNAAGNYTFAFAIACSLAAIGSYCGKTYQVTETDPKITDYDYIYNRTTTFIFMQLAGLFFCIINGYNFNKFLIIMLLTFYRGIDTLTEAIHAITQRNGDLYKTGISLFAKTIIFVIIFLITDLLTKSLLISCIVLCIVSVIIFYFVDYLTAKKYTKKHKYNNENNIKLLKRGFLLFMYAFLSVYVINSPKYALEKFGTEEAQAIFGIIVMPASFLSLISVYIVQPFLNKITFYIKETNKVQLVKLVIKICVVILLFGIFAIGVAYFVGIPLLELVYGIELNNQLLNLIIIFIGAIFYSFAIIIAAVIIALRNILEQVIIFIINAVSAYFITNWLVANNLIFGASLSYLLVMIIQFILYVIILKKALGKLNSKDLDVGGTI